MSGSPPLEELDRTGEGPEPIPPPRLRRKGVVALGLLLSALFHVGLALAIFADIPLQAQPPEPDMVIALARPPPSPPPPTPPPQPWTGLARHLRPSGGGGAPAHPSPTRRVPPLSEPVTLSPFAPPLAPSPGLPALVSGPPARIAALEGDGLGISGAGPGAGQGVGSGPGSGGGQGAGAGGPGGRFHRVEWSGWIHRPTLKEVSDLYPSGANHRRLDGYVVLACTIRADTRTRRCEVTTERPRGEGFGAAALRMTDLFRMHPVRIDGQVSEKVRVLVPIHFGGSGQDGPTQTLTPAPTILLEADK